MALEQKWFGFRITSLPGQEFAQGAVCCSPQKMCFRHILGANSDSFAQQFFRFRRPAGLTVDQALHHQGRWVIDILRAGGGAINLQGLVDIRFRLGEFTLRAEGLSLQAKVIAQLQVRAALKLAINPFRLAQGFE